MFLTAVFTGFKFKLYSLCAQTPKRAFKHYILSCQANNHYACQKLSNSFDGKLFVGEVDVAKIYGAGHVEKSPNMVSKRVKKLA